MLQHLGGKTYLFLEIARKPSFLLRLNSYIDEKRNKFTENTYELFQTCNGCKKQRHKASLA